MQDPRDDLLRWHFAVVIRLHRGESVLDLLELLAGPLGVIADAADVDRVGTGDPFRLVEKGHVGFIQPGQLE